MYATLAPSGKLLALSAVTLLCPCSPSKIIALWNNFHALALKLGKPAPKYPLFLLKPASCAIGPGEVIRGSALVNVDISGEIENLRVNGVDVVPLVEAELNRRYPEGERAGSIRPSASRNRIFEMRTSGNSLLSWVITSPMP